MKKRKINITDEDLAKRNLKEAMSRLPLEMRIANSKPEEILKFFSLDEILECLKNEDLKILKEKLDKLNLN